MEQQTKETLFSSFGLDSRLVRAVDNLGFTEPTPIQSDAIPPAIRGRDILACAMTGSGKTAAFLLPIMHQMQEKPGRGTRALILSPTRELAAQILEHFEQLAKHTSLRAAAVYGGVAMGPQERAFRQGVDLLIATPGRLLDHFNYPHAKLPNLEFLVLDEADRMLDMGFLPDIRRIMDHLPNKPRQTFCFSATIPKPIVQLTREMLTEPATINLESKQAPADGITQMIYPVPQHLKMDLLVELVRRREIGNAIVFCRTKHRADRLAEQLQKRGIKATPIHGNRSQRQRGESLENFKKGRYQILVATDVVARGIDIEALDHVVNFDVPNIPADYIHRIGRTARAQLTGEALTFVSREEAKLVRDIEIALGEQIELREIDDFDYQQKPREGFGGGGPRPQRQPRSQGRSNAKDDRRRQESEKALAGGGNAPWHRNRRRNNGNNHQARPSA